VGDIDRIKIRSDNSGLGPAWHLQQVDILSSATNQSYHFPYSNWCVQAAQPITTSCTSSDM
jgi:hypothetical protein